MPKKIDPLDALGNWFALNEFLREASEADCERLLKEEKRGQRRVQYLLRIHARYNKQRGQRERGELLTGSIK